MTIQTKPLQPIRWAYVLPHRLRVVLVLIVLYRLCGQGFLDLPTGFDFLNGLLAVVRGGIAIFGLYGVWPILAYCVFVRIRARNAQHTRIALFLPLVIFTVYVVVRAITSPYPDVGLERVWDLLSNSLPLAVCALLIGDGESIRWLRNGFLIVGILYLVAFAVQGKAGLPADANSHSLKVEQLGFGKDNNNTIGLAILLGAFLLSGATYVIESNIGGWRRVSILGCMIAWALIDLKVGSRGPIVALTVAMGASVLILRVSVWKKIGILAVCWIIVLGIWQSLPDSAAAHRFQSLARELQRGGEARNHYYSFALQAPVTPVGSGPGSFAADYSTFALDYPHNLFLELHYEHGLVGLILMMVLLTTTGRIAVAILQTSRSETLALCLLLLLYSLVEAQFSGTFWQNRWLAFLIVLTIAHADSLSTKGRKQVMRRPIPPTPAAMGSASSPATAGPACPS